MSCISFTCKYDHRMQCTAAVSPPSLNDPGCRDQLADLMGSNDAFLSHLEAIHYLNFPGIV